MIVISKTWPLGPHARATAAGMNTMPRQGDSMLANLPNWKRSSRRRTRSRNEFKPAGGASSFRRSRRREMRPKPCFKQPESWLVSMRFMAGKDDVMGIADYFSHYGREPIRVAAYW